ncbi:hypothetical protein [Klebsiella quasivariicola]|uniref:hypothetical protein n=1 Tax=Klebsiella quasivariicola TaxID=2026240 RepID=UPI002479EFDD|nr:hypothetical protein [Klebsiella quasivariicola]
MQPCEQIPVTEGQLRPGFEWLHENYEEYRKQKALAELQNKPESFANQNLGTQTRIATHRAFNIWKMIDWEAEYKRRPDTVRLAEEIAARNNGELNKQVKYWEGLSKAASLYYQSEYNKQHNAELLQRLGNNQVHLSTKERHIDKVSGLVGQRYGKLTIIARDKQEILCVCDCGTEKVYNRGNVVSGRTRSCGCAKEKK